MNSEYTMTRQPANWRQPLPPITGPYHTVENIEGYQGEISIYREWDETCKPGQARTMGCCEGALIARIEFHATTADDGGHWRQARANAEFICRAVNAFTEREALSVEEAEDALAEAKYQASLDATIAEGEANAREEEPT